MILSISNKKRAFTLVELMISVSIFAFMTALIIAKYGTFNDGTILTNTAYDVALTVRMAQSYGVSVRGTESQTSQSFNYPYGISFTTASETGSHCPNQVYNSRFVLFLDANRNGLFDCTGDSIVQAFNIKRGAKITALQNDLGTTNNRMDVIFNRPNPDALISLGLTGNQQAGKVQISSADNSSTRWINISRVGQISVTK